MQDIDKEGIHSPRAEVGHNWLKRIFVNQTKLGFLGHFIAALICLIAFFEMGKSIYQLDFWENYFFSGTQGLNEDSCRIAVKTQPQALFLEESYRPIGIPHDHAELAELFKTDAPNFYAHYQCRIFPEKRYLESNSLVYLHMSWLVGTDIRVAVNGRDVIHTREFVRPALALMHSDLQAKGGLLVDIYLKNENKFFGVVGNAPTVLANSGSINTRIFGLDYSLMNTRFLYKSLPLLSLSIILVFAWFIGYRYPILIATFDYALITLLQVAVISLSQFNLAGIIEVDALHTALQFGTYLPLLHFAMHLVGYRLSVKQILIIMGINYLILGFIVSLALSINHNIFSHYAGLTQPIFALVVYLGIFTLVIKRRCQLKSASQSIRIYRSILLGFLVLTTILLGTSLIECAHSIFGITSGIDLTYYTEQMIPIFIGCILVLIMTTIDDLLSKERSQRILYENELSMASTIQNLLLPRVREGSKNDWNYKIISHSHNILGGDWAKLAHSNERSLYVLGDVVGKGASAALTHSGISAIWESCMASWQKPSGITGSQILERINSIMFSLFNGKMNTSVAMAEILDEKGLVALLSGGNVWLHIHNNSSCDLLMPQSKFTLGSKNNFAIEPKQIKCQPGDYLITFTDGVLEGSRALGRLVKEIRGANFTHTFETIEEALVRIGKSSVQPDDSSILLLRRN